jgi:hypothetical protein
MDTDAGDAGAFDSNGPAGPSVPPARFDMRSDRFAAASGSGASPPRRDRPYGRAIVMTGDVQVSQCAGLLSSPSALSTEIFTT